MNYLNIKTLVSKKFTTKVQKETIDREILGQPSTPPSTPSPGEENKVISELHRYLAEKKKLEVKVNKFSRIQLVLSTASGLV
jgi:hypothetical protein